MNYFAQLFNIGCFYYCISLTIGLFVLVGMRIGRRSWGQCFAAALAAAYLFLVLSITIFTRGPTNLEINYLPPFWAYEKIFSRSKIARDLTIQIIVNILMLAPLGFLFPFITEKHPVCLAASCSIAIELIQLVTKRGYFELDDIIHNTIGILLGFVFYRLL